MPTENVAHRLIREPVTQVGHGTHDPVIAPPGISRPNTRFLHSPSDDLLAGKISIRQICWRRVSVPAENRIRVRRCCEMSQSLASQPVSNLGQCCLFTFRRQQPNP